MLKNTVDSHNYAVVGFLFFLLSGFCPRLLLFHPQLRAEMLLFTIPSLKGLWGSFQMSFQYLTPVHPLLTALEQVLQQTAGRYCVGDEVST